jgi:hypothetical protein
MAVVTLGLVSEPPERIIGASGPALRTEQRLRYALAADLVQRSALWCDLGCGDGVQAASALGEPPAARTLLVEATQESLEEARRQFPGETVVTLQADLGADDGVRKVAAAISEQSSGGPVTITCFDCIERLASFTPLVSTLVQLAEHQGVTVLLSVPNDAFWSVARPDTRTSWGEGAFEELRTLLPSEAVVLRQVVLQGSAITRADGDPELRPVEVELEPLGVPSHMLVAFGPERERVAPSAAVAQIDMEEQRRWERERDADLAALRAGRVATSAAQMEPGDGHAERTKQTA